MSATTLQKGRRIIDIDPARLDILNAGYAETTTLTENLAIDFVTLLRSVAPDIGEDAICLMEGEAKSGISKRMALVARFLDERLKPDALEKLRGHPSDTVRGWMCFADARREDMMLGERLAVVRAYADDGHFGVREWAWMAVRPYLAAELDAAIALLSHWTDDPSGRVRRFASESIRPRGVWCAHIDALKKNPEKALPVLEPLRADPAGYVQDSVGNWLNDAAKTRTDWVSELCSRWERESPEKATERIIRRALRSVGGKTRP